MIAKTKDISIKEYQKLEAEKIKKNVIRELKEQYKHYLKFDDVEEEPKEDIVEMYRQRAERFNEAQKENINKQDNIMNLYKNPLESDNG